MTENVTEIPVTVPEVQGQVNTFALPEKPIPPGPSTHVQDSSPTKVLEQAPESNEINLDFLPEIPEPIEPIHYLGDPPFEGTLPKSSCLFTFLKQWQLFVDISKNVS